MTAIQRRNFQGQRANDLLSITVGTQSISPFYWSIDSGVMDALAAMHTNGFHGFLEHVNMRIGRASAKVT